MPIYEYQCKACNEKFEKLIRSTSAEAKVQCPACGSKKVEKALSVFAVGAEGAGKSAARPPGCAGCCGAEGACPMQE